MTFWIVEITFGIGDALFTLIFPVLNEMSDIAGTQ